MRIGVALWLGLALAPAAAAQFDSFTWTLQGNPDGSGFVTPDMLHVTGPDGGTCSEGTTTWMETVAPWPATISVIVDYITLDDWPSYKYFDAPAWVVDGITYKAQSPTPGWWSDTYTIEFDVLPGQTFGFGIWAEDCCCGPGLGDFRDLVVIPHEWLALGPALDPQLGPVLEGGRVDAIGDLDGDGRDDVLVGLTSEEFDVVRVHSVADGTVLFEKFGNGDLGTSVAGPGDLDGDGMPDLVAGAPNDTTLLPGAGILYAWSGSDGAQLFAVAGTLKNAHLGSVVAGPGDLTGDGLADVITRSVIQGKHVHLLAGPDGAEIATITQQVPGEEFGANLAGPGDVDLDGVPDLLVGVPAVGVGRVDVYSGADQSLLTSLTGTSPSFGAGLAAAGDLDGDGVPDFVVSEASWQLDGQLVGAVTAYSGTGSPLFQVFGAPGAPLFSSVDGGADVTGDGELDLLTTQGANPARLQVRESGQGDVVFEFASSAPEPGVGAVAIIGNVDALGPEDVALVTASVGVVVIKAVDGLGAPTLEGRGVVAPNSLVTLAIAHGLPGAPGLLVLGLGGAQVPLLGGVLQPQPDVLVPLVLGLDGSLVVQDRWPPGLPQHTTVWMQVWIQDPAGPQGWSSTNGVIATQLGG